VGLALVVGGVAGFLSGLLGIGGGTVLVPFLYLLLSRPDLIGVSVDPALHATLAHATSLAVIMPTALSGFLAYRRKGLVDGVAILPLGISAALAALVGAQVAVFLPSDLLKMAFGCMMVWIGWRLYRGRRAEQPVSEGRMRPWAAWAGGGVVGFLSAILGIGGGVLAVPILLRWARLDLHRVTAASIGIVGFAAPAGILSYMWAGRGIEGLPPASLGFVSIPLALALIPGAVLMAPLGARLNQRLPVHTLRLVFATFLLTMGVRLLWVYLPIPG